MNIGKIFVNNQYSNNLNIENAVVNVSLVGDNNKLQFEPTKKCKYRLFGPKDNSDGNFGSMIKDLDDTEIELYLKYSLINFSSDDLITSLVVYITPDNINPTGIFENDNIILFVYKLNVIDTKYSLKYNEEFALVDPVEVKGIDEFIVKYEDEFGNKVFDDEYVSISANEWNNSFIDETFIPNEITNIGIYVDYINDNNEKEDIKLSTLTINFPTLGEEKCYSVGVVGDIRFSQSQDQENTETNKFENLFGSIVDSLYNECDFICSTGNVCNENSNDLETFINIINNKNVEMYAPLGNRDNHVVYTEEVYKNQWFDKFSGSQLIDGEQIFRCPHDRTSFYFLKEGTNSLNQKFYDCFIFVSLDYGFNDFEMSYHEKLSDNPYDYQAYNPKTIDWLMKALETNKFHRTFVFTNLYFSSKAGNYHNDDKYSTVQIDENKSNILAGSQFSILNELNNRYHNTIWFTGNSEYGFEWQQFDKEIIMCSNDYAIDLTNKPYQRIDNNVVCNSAINVHVPGFINAQEVQDSYIDDHTNISSQSFIMNVYKDCVDLIGYIHKTRSSSEYINKKCPYACYRINISGK